MERDRIINQHQRFCLMFYFDTLEKKSVQVFPIQLTMLIFSKPPKGLPQKIQSLHEKTVEKRVFVV
jgi:hypothetical protein